MVGTQDFSWWEVYMRWTPKESAVSGISKVMGREKVQKIKPKNFTGTIVSGTVWLPWQKNNMELKICYPSTYD